MFCGGRYLLEWTTLKFNHVEKSAFATDVFDGEIAVSLQVVIEMRIGQLDGQTLPVAGILTMHGLGRRFGGSVEVAERPSTLSLIEVNHRYLNRMENSSGIEKLVVKPEEHLGLAGLGVKSSRKAAVNAL